MVYIISRGVGVVAVCEGGEELWVENRVSVSILFPHRFVACKTSPVVKSVPFVDYQLAPEMSIWQCE